MNNHEYVRALIKATGDAQALKQFDNRVLGRVIDEENGRPSENTAPWYNRYTPEEDARHMAAARAYRAKKF